MNVITTFQDKQQTKKIAFERKVLRELSLKQLEEEVTTVFKPFFQYTLLHQDEVLEACLDVAIEAYLQGADYSRFSYYGESIDQIKKRWEESQKALIDSLYEYWQFWSYDYEMAAESIYITCETFVSIWWMRGFEKGEKRYRLRLH